MKKRILMLNFEFPPIGGGAANANYYLLKEFSKHHELEIDLVTSGLNGKVEIDQFSDNIKIYKLKINKQDLHYWRMSEVALWTWKAYWYAGELIKKKDYDLCHCWFGWPAGIIGYLLKKRIHYIVALRGSDVPGYNERLKVWDKILFKFVSLIIWKNAKSVIALSNNLRELANKTFQKKHMQVIYNGVDTKKYTPVIRPSDTFNILFAGRLINRKGVIYLLKAFNEVYYKYKNCKLTIVGGGLEKEDLERYCNKEKIKSVEFSGIINNSEISKIYQNAHVLVLPSLQEALGNVPLEAMASGMPIITTNTGAVELLDGNGVIVETENYKQIEDAIVQYIDNPELLRKHGLQSRRIAEKFSWENCAHAYMQIYDSII